MASNTADTYAFHAFISYRRGEKDEKYARRLQRKLEAYRIPTAVESAEVTANAGQSARHFKVFRDKSDLGSHPTVSEGLHKSLDLCRYLIVICSPRSAYSEYVNQEVRHFMEQGRAGYIIPVIIDGKPAPGSGAADNCYPDSLPASILGVTLSEGSFEEALLKTVARLLRVDFHTLYQRHLRAQRRFMAKVASSLALVLALVAGLALWAVNAERRATAQRREAEELVRFMTFDMRDEAFQYIPTKAREKITEKVEGYYQRWGAESLEARYVRVAHLGNRMLRLLEAGHWEQCEAMLSEMLALVAPLRKELPDDVDLLHIEATARVIRASLAVTRQWNEAETRGELEAALALVQELLDKRPGDPAVLRLAAWVRDNAARWHNLAGKDREGLPHAEAAVALRRELTAKHPDDARLQQEYLDTLNTLCTTQTNLGRTSPACGDLLAEYRRRAAEDPHNLNARQSLVGALTNQTRVLLNKGDFDAALAPHREALALLDDLLRRDPDNALYRSQMAITHALEAWFVALDQSRDPAEAMALLQQAEADLQRVTGKDRDNMLWRQAQASLQRTRTFVEMRIRRIKQADAYLAQTAEAEKRLATMPGNRRAILALGNQAVGAEVFLRGEERLDTALECLEKAEAAVRPLVRANPKDIEAQKLLLEILSHRSEVQRERKDFAAAHAAGQQALALLDGLDPSLLRDEGFRSGMADTLGAMAKVSTEMYDLRGARELSRRELALNRELAGEGGAVARLGLVGSLQTTGAIAADLGYLPEAGRLLAEAVDTSRQALAKPSLLLMGLESFLLASSLHLAAGVEMACGRLEAAEAELAEARELIRPAPSEMFRKDWRRLHLALLARQAALALRRGDASGALTLLGEAAGFDGRAWEENLETAEEFPPDQRWDLLTVEALLAADKDAEAGAVLERIRAIMKPAELEKSQETLFGGAAVARLLARLDLRAGRTAEAVAACESVLPALAKPAGRPEAGILFAQSYLEILSVYAEALEAAGRQAEAEAVWDKAAAYADYALAIAPGYATLGALQREILEKSGRLKTNGGAGAGARVTEGEKRFVPARRD